MKIDDKPSDAEAPVLEIRDLDKSFPGVHALKKVSLCLKAGEVLALVGENGAGKSTLLKILAGAQPADGGDILLGGRRTDTTSPMVAQQAGISIIYQEFNLVPDLTVRENIFLGREQTRGGFVRARWEAAQAQALFQRIGIAIDPNRRCRDLNCGRAADRGDRQGPLSRRQDPGHGRTLGHLDTAGGNTSL